MKREQFSLNHHSLTRSNLKKDVIFIILFFFFGEREAKLLFWSICVEYQLISLGRHEYILHSTFVEGQSSSLTKVLKS